MPIKVNSNDFNNAILFLQAFMREKFPNVSFSKGDALYDLVIQALSYYQGYLSKEIDYSRARMSINQLQTLITDGQETDTSVREIIENILSNFIASVKVGSKAYGVVNVYVTQYRVYEVPATTKFYRGGLKFDLNSSAAILINESDIVINDDDPDDIQYYFSLNIVASDIGSSYNVDPGEFTSWTIFSPYVDLVENTSKFSNGKDDESIETAMQRVELLPYDRNLTSDRGIKANLLENFFSSIIDIMTIGAGEAEMHRDRREFYSNLPTIHVLGHTNIYLKGYLSEEKDFSDTVVDGKVALPQEPILRINTVACDGDTAFVRESGVNAPTAVEKYTLEYAGSEKYSAYSAVQNGSFKVHSDYNTKVLTFKYKTLLTFSGIDSYIRNSHNRQQAHDNLLIAQYPVYIVADLQYRARSSALELIDQTEAIGKLSDFIFNFDTGEVLSVSDISAFLRESYAEIVDDVIYPITIYYYLDAPNGFWIPFKTQDQLLVNYAKMDSAASSYVELQTAIQDEVGVGNEEQWFTDLQLSSRTVRYFLNETESSIEVV